MFSYIYNIFLGIDLIDRILLFILLLSVLLKGISEFICWYLCKFFNVDKNYTERCIYLKLGSKQDCKRNKCKEKYFIQERCNKEKCPGYRVSNYSIDEIKQIHKLPFAILTIFKWVSELSTIILIVRTLLMTDK